LKKMKKMKMMILGYLDKLCFTGKSYSKHILKCRNACLSRRFPVFIRLQEKKGEIVKLFKLIISDYNTLQYNSFINKIINNDINIKERYSQFLVLLEKEEEIYWKVKMKVIFN
jgi:hypothetical protein